MKLYNRLLHRSFLSDMFIAVLFLLAFIDFNPPPPRKFRNVFFNTIIFVVQAKVYNLFII